jgi:ribonuclease HI
VSKDKEDIFAYIHELDKAWAAAYADPSCLVVAADGSAPLLPGFQAAPCALVFREGVEVGRVVSAAGRRSPPELELFAIQLGVSWAVARGCTKLVVFSDSRPALDSLLHVKPRSGQIFSLDACKSLRPWFAEEEEHTLALWHVPARFEWKVQKLAHDAVIGIRISVGPRPRTSRDYLAAACDVAAIRDWHAEFRKPSYRGNTFVDLEGSKRRPILPSTHKGGPWLQEARRELGVFTRLVRSITGHAPIGAYRRKFKIPGPDKCPCDYHTLPDESVEHVTARCPKYRRKRHHAAPRTVGGWCNFLRQNFFAFAFGVPIVWDPR